MFADSNNIKKFAKFEFFHKFEIITVKEKGVEKEKDGKIKEKAKKHKNV